MPVQKKTKAWNTLFKTAKRLEIDCHCIVTQDLAQNVINMRLVLAYQEILWFHVLLHSLLNCVEVQTCFWGNMME